MNCNLIIVSALIAASPLVPSRPSAARWSESEAQVWYAHQPWTVGANYVPSDAINELDIFQPDTFNRELIDKELGLADSIGMSTMRVFLQDQLWTSDPAGFRGRVDTFLSIAGRHHIRLMLVSFDSCWEANPHLGPQHPPIPGVHNLGWVQSSGKDRLLDTAAAVQLKVYVQGVIGALGRDDRVWMWDVWNEPANRGGDQEEDYKRKVNRVNELLPQVFAWAREMLPMQPLTSAVWDGDWVHPETESATTKIQLEESDVLSFHGYNWPEKFEEQMRQLQAYHRPIVCTECMARGNGRKFDTVLPVAKRYRVAAINWGFVNGKIQTDLPWDSWQRPYVQQRPPIWFHDIFRQDGYPYREAEVDRIRELTQRS